MSISLGIVVIGRNEGPRLIACLTSLKAHVTGAVYVDSGSSDNSREEAVRLGAKVITLDPGVPFTAARARNAGFSALLATHPDIEYVQFVDGDCQLTEGWLDFAQGFLTQRPDVAVVCGQRRERYPEKSIYNRMCDDEWNTPVGEATACGGDAMMRRDAFEVAGGYTATMIAGEEPELCIRLRKAGWRIWRVDADMTLHDADITRFQQWWRRSVRAGYAYADVSWRYRNSQHRIWSKQTRRAVVWSAVLPLALFLAVVIHPAFLALLLIYPVQIARLALKSGWEKADSWKFAYFSVVGKFAELRGILSRHLSRRQELIEYK